MVSLFGKKKEEPAQHGSIKIVQDSPDSLGRSALTTPAGETIYAFISPLPQDGTNYSYAKEALPGVYRLLMTIDNGFKPLADSDLPAGFDLDASPAASALPGMQVPGNNLSYYDRALIPTIVKALSGYRVTAGESNDIHLVEFEFPFSAAFALNWSMFTDGLKIPDHGLGHVVSIPGGRKILVHAIKPDNTADDILALNASTQHIIGDVPVAVSPLVYWVHDGAWDILTPSNGQGGIFFPESFPVKRDAQGAPVTSSGEAGTRVDRR